MEILGVRGGYEALNGRVVITNTQRIPTNYDKMEVYQPGCIVMNHLERITLNPLVMGGKPTVRGLRITVGTIVGLVASDHSFARILELYPDLEVDDIRAALAYAAWRAEEIDIPLST